MSESSVPVFKITVPITKSELTLNVGGDYHYGVRNVSKDELIRTANKESDQHRGNIFRVLTGDLIENALKTSVGHNYDIAIPDPQDQKDDMKKILKEVMEYQYGKATFQRLKISENRLTGCQAAGCCGNHEYRSRKQSGQWIDRDMYQCGKILSLGMQGILELKLVNKKLKMEKTYRAFVAHRPSGSSSSSTAGLLRAMLKKRADIPGCDLYIFGHFHKRFISPDGHYDSKTGTFKKILYVVNPSPMYDVEYADVAGYSPLVTGYHVNIYLPIDQNKFPYGIV